MMYFRPSRIHGLEARATICQRGTGFQPVNPRSLLHSAHAAEYVTIFMKPCTKAESALPLVSDLGPGETEVLMLGLELRESIVILDDALGRRMAEALVLKFTGTLGLLLDAKRSGLIPSIRPLLDQLEDSRFRLSLPTRQAILQLAGEER